MSLFVRGRRVRQRLRCRAAGDQVGGTPQQLAHLGGQLPLGLGGPPLSAATGDGGQPRDNGRAQHQGDQQDDSGRGQQPPGDQHRHPAGDHRCADRQDHPECEVLHRVDVGHQPGQQVTAPEAGHPLGREHLEPPPHDDPHVGEHPEHGVVGEQPLGVPEEPAADAERTHGDDRDLEGEHRWHLGGAGDQPPAHREEPDRAQGGERAEQRRAGERSPYRPQRGQGPAQRRARANAAGPCEALGGHARSVHAGASAVTAARAAACSPGEDSTALSCGSRVSTTSAASRSAGR